MPMGTDKPYDVFDVEPKPDEKPKAKAAPAPEPAEENRNGLTPEEFAAVRRDIRRMWSPEPEETR